MLTNNGTTKWLCGGRFPFYGQIRLDSDRRGGIGYHVGGGDFGAAQLISFRHLLIYQPSQIPA